MISLQTSFKNHLWQRFEQRKVFQDVSEMLQDGPKATPSPSRLLQDAPRRLLRSLQQPSDGLKRFQDIVWRWYRDVCLENMIFVRCVQLNQCFD